MRLRSPAALALVFTLAAVAATEAAGQESVQQASQPKGDDPAAQDTVGQDTLPRDTLPPAPALGYEPAVFSLALAFGTAGSGDTQSQPVWVRRADLSGAVMDSALVSRTVALRGAYHGGASGTLGLGAAWAVRLGFGLTKATLEAGYSGTEDAASLVGFANTEATADVDLQVLSLETALLYRIPSRRRVQPYLELGAAVSRWGSDGPVAESLGLKTATRLEIVAGFGGVIPITRRFSAEIRASTRLLRTPVVPRAANDTLGARSSPGWPPTLKNGAYTTTVVTRRPAETPFADEALELVSLLRFQIGFSLDLGRPPLPAAQPEPDEAVETTSPPGR